MEHPVSGRGVVDAPNRDDERAADVSAARNDGGNVFADRFHGGRVPDIGCYISSLVDLLAEVTRPVKIFSARL